MPKKYSSGSANRLIDALAHNASYREESKPTDTESEPDRSSAHKTKGEQPRSGSKKA